MDIKKDGLLAVFARLPLDDRLRFRVNRQLASFEKDAAPIDVADDRTKLKELRFSVSCAKGQEIL